MNLSSSISTSELFGQIIERSLSAFFLYNLKAHRFEYLNPAFEDIWERSSNEINEDLPSLLANISQEDRPLVLKSFERLQGSALRQNLEFRILIGNKQKWINLTAYAIVKGESSGCLAGFAEEITHFKENEIFANKISTHKDAILEMLSHDLGGPLGIALRLAEQIAKESRGSEQIDIQQKAELIQQTLGHSIHLISDYLQKEYLESSQVAIKRQRVELIEQLKTMLDGFRRMDIEGHKHFHLESSCPKVFVEVDQVKFHQIFSNLVSNANKFTHENGHITLRVQERGNTLLLSVSDDGIGIPASMQGVLFERFTKARRPGLHGEETQGLGLSIVKRLVEIHEGRIWVESEENKGSTFFVEIPYGL